MVRRADWPPHPWAFSRTNSATPVRSDLPSGVDAFAVGSNFDELRVAVLTGIPVKVFVWFALWFLAATGLWLLRYLPRGNGIDAAVSMVAGTVVSLVAYAGYVGPWLLP